MIGLPILAAGVIMNIIAVFWFLCAIVMILIILIQKGRGGGLGAAFGGGMGSSLLGSKTGDFLTWVTIGLVVVFLGLAILMAKYLKPTGGNTGSTAVAGQAQPAASPQQTPAPPVQQPEIPAPIEAPTEVPQPTPVEEFEMTDLNSLPLEE